MRFHTVLCQAIQNCAVGCFVLFYGVAPQVAENMTYMMPLKLKALLRRHVVLLQQLPLLSKQRVAVGDGGRDCHFVVGILLVHYAIVEQEAAVGLGPTPRKYRLTCIGNIHIG